MERRVIGYAKSFKIVYKRSVRLACFSI